MGVASLILGIFSVILAALCTAFCFSWLAFLGVPLALLGIVLGAGEVFATVRGHYRGVEEFPNLRHGVTGAILCTVAAVWMVGRLLLGGGTL